MRLLLLLGIVLSFAFIVFIGDAIHRPIGTYVGAGLGCLFGIWLACREKSSKVPDKPPTNLPHITAHKHSIRNKAEILASEKCGCFYCLAIFSPGEINEWIDVGRTALCPKCKIDSVIGSASEYPITQDFLKQMEEHWFSVN